MKLVTDFLFLGSKITVDGACSYETKTIVSWQESNDKLREYVEKQRYYSANKGPHSLDYGLPSGQVWL